MGRPAWELPTASARFDDMGNVKVWALALATALGAAMSSACAATVEKAAIVDSGSTNTSGYRIDVASDGGGRLTMEPHPGSDVSTTPKNFRMDAALAQRFFNDLKAVRDVKVAGVPCMKSASFGTSTHVKYGEWTSPDLDCPSPNELMNALIEDVRAIRQASGVGETPGITPGGPLRVRSSASPKPVV